MKDFLWAMTFSGAIYPVVLGLSIFVCFLFGLTFVFRSVIFHPNPFVALGLLALGIVWTVKYQSRIKRRIRKTYDEKISDSKME
jgi:hypothetical protein